MTLSTSSRPLALASRGELVRQYRDAVGRSTAEFAPSLTVIGVFLGAGYAIQPVLGSEPLMSVRWYIPVLIDFSVGALFLAAAALLAHRWSSLRSYAATLPALAGWRLAAADCISRTLTPERVVRLMAACVMTPLLFATYGSWKSAIPRLSPFTWDEPLARVIEPIAGGIHPWQWLQPMLGHPLLTLAIDRVYASLFVVIVAVVLWQAWHDDAAVRARFFLSFTLMWFVLGVVAAMLVASVGPCFYAGIASGPDPYRPLLDYLARVDRQHPLIALQTQHLLWNAYTHHVPTSLTGISAFPSLHVGATVLFMLAGFRQNRWLGAAFGAYALLIWIGSIHLGWHYAVDGYAAALGVTVIWIAVGRMVAAHTGSLARDGVVYPKCTTYRPAGTSSKNAA